MKKILVILILALVAGCAAKEEPFDPVAKFKEGEGYMRKESFEKARKAYQEIQEKATDRSYDADIMLRIADTYFGEEKYDEALVEYQSFLNFHPVNRDAPYAQYQIAMCSYNEIDTIDRDPEVTRTALKEFQKLLQKYPKSSYEEAANKYSSVCKDKLSEYEFYVGRFYHKKGSYGAAAGRFEKLLRDFPGSTAEKDALYYAGLSYVELSAREKGKEEQAGRKTQAFKTFETLVNKYPSMRGEVAPIMSRLQSK